MRFCVFPGTFNPIHDGHIKMAEFALKKYNFDKIIFIPSYIPPHKNVETNLAEHRLNMVKMATSFNPKFDVSDIEYKSDGKSYSLITVQKLIEQYNLKTRLNFIIGTDAFVKLDTWYKADELKKLVHFIVFKRRGDGNEEIYKEFEKAGWDFKLAEMDFVDISSTEIRKTLGEKIINKNIREYIKENELYRD